MNALTSRPRCSLCMITRDESDVIAGALASVRFVVDEMIVVDTGSTDATPSIARAQGATVVHRDWEDDFSRARNQALDLASGQWILILDADERLDESSIGSLQEILRGPTQAAYTFRQHTYLDHTRASGLQPTAEMPEPYRRWPGYVLARQTRLFPADPSVRYEGRVHEEVLPSLDRLGCDRHSTEVIVHHLGKVRGKAVDRRKRELYLRLGRAKVETEDGPLARFELGIAFMEVGAWKEAEGHLRRAAESADDLALRSRCVAAWSRALLAVGRSDRAVAVLTDHLPEVAAYLPVWEAWADTLLRIGQPRTAVTVLENCIPLFDDQIQLWRMLAEAQERLGNGEAAEAARRRVRELGAGSAASPAIHSLG